MKPTESKYSVATVVTEDFVPGALVTLHSFLRRNSWFQGDVVVLHDDLSEETQNAFKTLVKWIRFEPVSNELREWARRMMEARPELAGQRSQFFALEVFRLAGYEKVLFCDSDLLFRADIRELWERPEPLLCCRDRPAYLGNGRDRRTFAMCLPNRDALVDTFNSGLLLIDQSLINDTEYDRLLNVLSPEEWSSVTAAHTDQLILNHAFAGRQCLLDGDYNYLLKHSKVIQQQTGIGIRDAKVLHYNLAAKPWRQRQLVHFMPNDPLVYEAIQWWNDAFVACLQAGFVRRTATASQ